MPSVRAIRPVRQRIHTVLVGPYPPTRCGIATFTENTRRAVLTADPRHRVDVLRVGSPDLNADRAPEIIGSWTAMDPPSAAAARCAGADVVVFQHEFGIFGGPDGEDVVEFVADLRVPFIVVLHTVVAEPSERRRAIIEAITRTAGRVVVLSRPAANRLVTRYHVDPDNVSTLPDGADPNVSRSRTGGTLSPSLLTWGPLGPGKGIEHAIEAVAILAGRGIPVRYTVASQTHPKVFADEGERYRERLVELARTLGVESTVKFVDTYCERNSLHALIRSSNVVVLPYDSPEHVTSGALMKALASAKPIIATAFPHACEVLPGQAGIVVPHESPDAIADAIETVVTDERLHRQHALGSGRLGSEHAWPLLGAHYAQIIGSVLAKSLRTRA